MSGRNNRPQHNQKIELPPAAMEAAQRMAMQEAQAAQQQMHLQMLHQSTMRECFVKFVEHDMNEVGFKKAANKAANAAKVFMNRLGVGIEIAVPPEFMEEPGDKPSEPIQQ